MPQISNNQLNELKKLGYTGKASIEDIIKPLSKKMFSLGMKYIDHPFVKRKMSWWIVLKDKNKDKSFIEVVYENLIKELKGEQWQQTL